jgi:hypothetical protein
LGAIFETGVFLLEKRWGGDLTKAYNDKNRKFYKEGLTIVKEG